MTTESAVPLSWDAEDIRGDFVESPILQEARRLVEGDGDYLLMLPNQYGADGTRLLAMGSTPSGNVIVAWVEPTEGDLRILSARHATLEERVLLDGNREDYIVEGVVL